METYAGVWIDHRKAVVVTLSDDGEQIQQINSNVEKQPGRIDGQRSITPFSSAQTPADDIMQRAFTHHLNIFYEEVRILIGDAQSILIFGPGEAKGELKKIMKRHCHDCPEICVEPADKMTDREIAAKSRHYFAAEKIQGKELLAAKSH